MLGHILRLPHPEGPRRGEPVLLDASGDDARKLWLLVREVYQEETEHLTLQWSTAAATPRQNCHHVISALMALICLPSLRCLTVRSATPLSWWWFPAERQGALGRPPMALVALVLEVDLPPVTVRLLLQHFSATLRFVQIRCSTAVVAAPAPEYPPSLHRLETLVLTSPLLTLTGHELLRRGTVRHTLRTLFLRGPMERGPGEVLAMVATCHNLECCVLVPTTEMCGGCQQSLETAPWSLLRRLAHVVVDLRACVLQCPAPLSVFHAMLRPRAGPQRITLWYRLSELQRSVSCKSDNGCGITELRTSVVPQDEDPLQTLQEELLRTIISNAPSCAAAPDARRAAPPPCEPPEPPESHTA